MRPHTLDVDIVFAFDLAYVECSPQSRCAIHLMSSMAMLKLTQENLLAKKTALMHQICYTLIKPSLVGFVNAQITPLSGRRQQNTARKYTDQLCSLRNNGTMLKVLSK